MTMRRALPVVVLVLACGSGGGGGESPDAAPVVPDAPPIVGSIDDRLRAIPEITVTSEVTAVPSGYRGITFTFDQPEDHAAPGGAHFRQRAVLLHRDDTSPVVVYTTGYGLPALPGGRAEPTQLVQGNQITIEHRFFAPSRADTPDWSKLTIRQSADDWHAIIGAFKRIYPGNRFVTTGASKGGMTSIFHRRFYPDDVDGTVAYVAPISFGAPDDRYVAFLEQTGLPDCRAKLDAFQREVLTRRTAMTARMGQNGTSYTILGVDVAFEHAALEFPWTFWQYDAPIACDTIPDPSATDDELYDFLDHGVPANPLSGYGDDDIEYYLPYYYQASVQLGYPKIDESNAAGLLDHPGTDVAPTYTPGLSPVWDEAAAMDDVAAWMRTDAAHILLVYGEYDPWSAGQFELGNATDSFKLVVAMGNHGSKISALDSGDQATALAALRRWAGVSAIAKPTLDAAEPTEMPRLRPW
jgi:hypothetical protein